MDPLSGFYACCYCCTPDPYMSGAGGCENPDRHTVPCLMCGQKVHDA